VLASATQRFDAYLARRDAIDPNLADSVVTLAARAGDALRFESMLEAFEHAATPQERRRFLFGLAEFRAPKLIDRALALCSPIAFPPRTSRSCWCVCSPIAKPACGHGPT
jgi:hypothetical protein